MSRNNVKLLTYRERCLLKDKYDFEYDGKNKNVIVKIKDYNRRTLHPSDENFSINSKIRKLTFSVDAINIWIEMLTNGHHYNLIDVQYIINKCYILYQQTDFKTVLSMLKEEVEKI